jgi:hypothetical protein
LLRLGDDRLGILDRPRSGDDRQDEPVFGIVGDEIPSIAAIGIVGIVGIGCDRGMM